MVQVNTSKEESKSGCEASEATTIASHITTDCKRSATASRLPRSSLGAATAFSYLVIFRS
eukprot:3585466-Rhodomonas_salina.1